MLAITIRLYAFLTLLAAASIVYAHGITVMNHQSHTLFLWSVADRDNVPTQWLNAYGGSYYEDWRLNPKGGAISIKISFTQKREDILQFEYSLKDKVAWDLSSINMKQDSLFRKLGFRSLPSDPSCPAAICPPNTTACKDSFEKADDNQVIRTCSSDVGILVIIGE
jgi:Bys1 family protein